MFYSVKPKKKQWYTDSTIKQLHTISLVNQLCADKIKKKNKEKF